MTTAKYIIGKVARHCWVVVDMSQLDHDGNGKHIDIAGVRHFLRKTDAQAALRAMKDAGR
jgi:hypothetical protein